MERCLWPLPSGEPSGARETQHPPIRVEGGQVELRLLGWRRDPCVSEAAWRAGTRRMEGPRCGGPPGWAGGRVNLEKKMGGGNEL